MRLLFGLLLLTNAIVLAWQYYLVPTRVPVDVTERLVSADVPSNMTLLGELPADRQPAKRAATSAEAEPANVSGDAIVDAPAGSVSCLEIAGLSREGAQQAWAAAGVGLGAEVIGAGSRRVEKLNYWVFVPPLDSRRQAEQLAGRFERSGIRDFYIVRSGEFANALSLGVFSSRDSAIQRASRLARVVPVEARIEELNLPGKQFWLRLRWPTLPENGWFAGLTEAASAVQTTITCPE